jgi:hypothetical protein
MTGWLMMEVKMLNDPGGSHAAEAVSSRRPKARRAGGVTHLGKPRPRRLSLSRLALADVEYQVGLADMARLFAGADGEAVDPGRW